MKYDRFDHEQAIMAAWNVISDLDTVMAYVVEDRFDSVEQLQDSVSNLLLGIRSLYDLRFQTLFRHFEDSIKAQYAAKQSTAQFLQD